MFTKRRIRTIVASTLAFSLVGMSGAHLSLAQQNTDAPNREATAQIENEERYVQAAQMAETVSETAQAGSTMTQSTETQSTETVNTEDTARILANVLNVRSGPSTDFPIVTTLLRDAQVQVEGRDAQNDWLLIDMSTDGQGWIFRGFTDYMALAPLVETPLAPPAAEAPAADPAVPPTIVTLDPNVNVNVRSGPSTGYTVLQRVTPGTQMDILGQDATRDWLYVRFSDGSEGWVARFLTNFVGTAPVMETPPLAQPPLAPPAAEAPAAEIPVETGPMALPYQPDPLTDPAPMVNEALSDNWRTLSVGETHWYYFDHAGDSLPIQIWMDSDPNEGAGFAVYSQRDAEAIMAGANPDDFSAIGHGTPNEVEPGYLFWRGDMAESERFYVMIEHGHAEDVPYTIFSAGPTL